MSKKIINHLILFLSFLIMGAWTQPKYCKISDRIFFAYNKELCKQKHLQLTGKGGAMMDDIQKVNANYVSFDRLTVEEARRLYVDVAEGYLCRYNQNEEIRPFLHNYPFTIGNFKIMIGFEDEQRRHMNQGFVALIYNGKEDRILYRAFDRELQKFVPLYEEPYETARDIVLKERDSMLQNRFSP